MPIFLEALSNYLPYFYMTNNELLLILIFFYHISPKVYDKIQNLCLDCQKDSHIIEDK